MSQAPEGLHVLPHLQIRAIHSDGPVKPPRTQQGLVKDVRPVGGRQDDDARVALEAIKLRQQLVDGLLALIVPAAHTSPALASDRINLIDEDDAWRLLLCLGRSPAVLRAQRCRLPADGTDDLAWQLLGRD